MCTLESLKSEPALSLCAIGLNILCVDVNSCNGIHLTSFEKHILVLAFGLRCVYKKYTHSDTGTYTQFGNDDCSEFFCMANYCDNHDVENEFKHE